MPGEFLRVINRLTRVELYINFRTAGGLGIARKAPRHEIASGGSGKIVPQESGAAGGLWGFGHVAD
jgi:hypothetical protein